MICHKLLETVHSNLNSYYQILSQKNYDVQTIYRLYDKERIGTTSINFISIFFHKSNQNASAKSAKCLFHGNIFPLKFRGEKKSCRRSNFY